MRVVLLIAAALAALPAAAQHQHGSDESAAAPAVHQASGTSANPASSPMEMIHLRAGGWSLMLHGTGFLTEIQQSGPRGGDKLAGMGWFMGVAERKLGRGTLTLRTMLSPDAATVTERRYPLLFQTGETAFGRPLVDAQHPHDLFMELSAQYRYPVAERTHLYVYFAPVGDPALGPVAFPHRVSAAELPQATLSHHVQDSSHIVNEVLTAGVAHGMFRVEASGFHGAEPNENRWNIDHGGMDSWSARVTVDPAPNWSAQVSLGRLHRPEALEPGDTLRSTASITYNRPLAAGNWATSVIWGRNHKTAELRNLNSYLVESVYQFRKRDYLTGRIELVDKDELFESGTTFRVAPYTIGYTRDVDLIPGLRTGFGANFTFYGVPAATRPFYGDHPMSVLVYLRIRLAGRQAAAHQQHMH